MLISVIATRRLYATTQRDAAIAVLFFVSPRAATEIASVC